MFEIMEDSKPETINLVTLIGNYLEQAISNEAANVFRQDKNIQSVINYPPSYQRVIINRFLQHKLLEYRINNNTPVYQITSMLIVDGTMEEWLTSITTYVIPFLKENSVLTTLVAV